VIDHINTKLLKFMIYIYVNICTHIYVDKVFHTNSNTTGVTIISNTNNKQNKD